MFFFFVFSRGKGSNPILENSSVTRKHFHRVEDSNLHRGESIPSKIISKKWLFQENKIYKNINIWIYYLKFIWKAHAQLSNDNWIQGSNTWDDFLPRIQYSFAFPDFPPFTAFRFCILIIELIFILCCKVKTKTFIKKSLFLLG